MQCTLNERIKILETQLEHLNSKKVAVEAELSQAKLELHALEHGTPLSQILQLSSSDKPGNQKSDKFEDLASMQGSLLSAQQCFQFSKTLPSNNFSANEKIKIFMNLFRGREDVFPKRWENAKTGKSGYSPACFHEWVRGKCNKPRIKCSDCLYQAFIPLTAEVIRKHLAGENIAGIRMDYTIGIYPMLTGDKCWFLAIDLDKKLWQSDATAFIHTCRKKRIPFALERSRSGNGGHVWIFFDQPILASQARKMGAALITETMDNWPDIGFESYDRMFPNQDTIPSGGFGNLIALPLQRLPREKGNSIFLDDNLQPYHDQWAFLASVARMTVQDVDRVVEEASCNDKIIGVRMPIEEDYEQPWDIKPSRKYLDIPIGQALPQTVSLVISNQLFIAKQNLPSALISKLIRLAAFQNPEFYIAQSMRLSTFGKPRIIACAEVSKNYIALPRGCLDEAIQVLRSLDIKVVIDDKRVLGYPIKLSFQGVLTQEQAKCAKKLSEYDIGVLAATTAFGKTVIGASMIATRNTNTLIIVHRKHLLDQWIEKLQMFLNLERGQIGTIGGGKYKPSKVVDVAIIQSLIKRNVVDDIVAEYGHIIIDECHHLSAVSFENVIKACKARYILGLTATATRKDGHHPIIFMQCGEIRYKVDAKKQAHLRQFDHKVIIKNTEFTITQNLTTRHDLTLIGNKVSISQIYSEIESNHQRNAMIIEDILGALKIGCSPLILTERKNHAVFFEQEISRFCKNVILMVGGQNTKMHAKIKEKLQNLPESEERVLISTGRYIGEGFDDKRLDTLFLTMPISWHGTLAQYAGRLHREYASKKEVVIYDYIDNRVPMLMKMADKRLKGYSKMGYVVA